MRKALLAILLGLVFVAWPAAQSPIITAPLTSATCPGSGCVVLSVNGMSSVSIQVAGTYTGTVQFEGSLDGSTYTALALTPSTGGDTATSTTSTGVWTGFIGGTSQVRARVSAYTSGTARVTIGAALGLAAPGLSGVVIGNGVQPATATALPNDATKFLDGTGAFTTGGAGVSQAYVDAAIAQAAGGGGVSQNSFLVNGGGVVWDSDYNFTVSAASYYIGGVLYVSEEQSITLTAADPTDDRIDIIVVDDDGVVSAVTGTAAAQPSEPDYDTGTQLKLSLVFVAANSTEPDTIVTTILYQDNAGDPTEWNWTTSGSGFNVNSSNNPRPPGTKTIEGTAVANGAYAQGQIGSGSYDTSTASLLVFYVRSKAAWSGKRNLQIQLLSSGVLKGTAITFGEGAFGFVSSNTTTYQQIAVPIGQFAIPVGTTINQIRFRDSGGSIGFYLADIGFQGGATTQVATGITQDQADVRYAPIGPSYVTLGTNANLINERVLTAGSGISLTDGGAGSTLTIAASGGSGPSCESHTAANSATLNFTTFYSASYRDYDLTIDGLVPSSGGTSLRMRLSEDGGSTWYSATEYGYYAFGASFTFGFNGAHVNSTGISSWGLIEGLGVTAGYSANGKWRIYNMGSNTLFPMMQGLLVNISNAGIVWGDEWHGGIFGTADTKTFNALQLYMDSGNIASGTVTVCQVLQ